MDQGLYSEQLTHFIAHPGGKKVLKAYEDTLYLSPQKPTFLGKYCDDMVICHHRQCYMY